MTLVALDIETDTSPLTQDEIDAGYAPRGLDPRIGAITDVVVYGDHHDEVLTGQEDDILRRLSNILNDAAEGTLVTWNGACFDLPFIHDRAKQLGVETGLVITDDASIVPKYEPLPGHVGGVVAHWGNLRHVDVAYKVKNDAAERGIPWSLKPYVREVLGIEPVEVDRERMHELTAAEKDAYVRSDGIVTYKLARHLGV